MRIICPRSLVCLSLLVCLVASQAVSADQARLLRTISLPPGYQVDALALSPDGLTVAYVETGLDGGRHFFLSGARTGQPVAVGDDADGPAFSPDGRFLAYTHFEEYGGVLSLYDVKRREHLCSTTLPVGDPLGGVAFSADGGTLACGDYPFGGGPCTVWLYRTQTLTLKRKLAGNIPVPYSIAFSSDGRYLAASGYSGDAGIGGTAVWSLDDRRLRHFFKEDGPVLFASDRHTLVCGDKIVDVSAAHARFQAFAGSVPQLKLIGMASGGRALFCHFDAHGNARGPFEMWGIRPRKRLQQWYGKVLNGLGSRYTFSSNGRTLAGAYLDNGRCSVKTWRLD